MKVQRKQKVSLFEYVYQECHETAIQVLWENLQDASAEGMIHTTAVCRTRQLCTLHLVWKEDTEGGGPAEGCSCLTGCMTYSIPSPPAVTDWPFLHFL